MLHPWLCFRSEVQSFRDASILYTIVIYNTKNKQFSGCPSYVSSENKALVPHQWFLLYQNIGYTITTIVYLLERSNLCAQNPRFFLYFFLKTKSLCCSVSLCQCMCQVTPTNFILYDYSQHLWDQCIPKLLFFHFENRITAVLYPSLWRQAILLWISVAVLEQSIS